MKSVVAWAGSVALLACTPPAVIATVGDSGPDAVMEATVDGYGDSIPPNVPAVDSGDSDVAAGPPRLIAPLSTARVTSTTPTFRWVVPPVYHTLTLAVASCRGMTQCPNAPGVGSMVLGQEATQYRWQTALGPGVYYWQVTSPLGSSPVWEFTVPAHTAPTDTSWGSTLDINGDGYADVAVGASGANNSAGRVYVWLGGPSGLSQTPSAMLAGPDGAGSKFGASVASAGDVNGDGFADLMVSEQPSSLTGRVYVYLGSATGLATTPAVTLMDTGEQPYGWSITSVGDVNDDGYADIVVGGLQLAEVPCTAHVFLGSANGITSTPSATLDLGYGPGGPGVFVAGAGDVNGDGFGDLLVGLPPPVTSTLGAASLYLGSASGFPMTPAVVLNGDGEFGYGVSVASAGDVNGDGLADFVVGGSGESGQQGAAFVYLGTTGALTSTPAAVLSGSPPLAGAGFGTSVASAGDVNGDGFDDVVVAAVSGDLQAGVQADVFLGSAGGIGSNAATPLYGPTGGPPTAIGLVGAGDVNGDGFADVLLGNAQSNQTPDSAGQTVLFLGAMTGIATTPAMTLTGSDGAGGAFGISVASRQSALRCLWRVL